MRSVVHRVRNVLVGMLCAALAACAMTGVRSSTSSTDSLLQVRAAATSAYLRGDAATARLLYKALSERAPDDVQVWRRLGNLYVLNGKNARALNAYAHAIKLGGADAEVWYNIGVIRVRQAERALIHAQQSAPPNSALHKSLASATQRLHAVFPGDTASTKAMAAGSNNRSSHTDHGE